MALTSVAVLGLGWLATPPEAQKPVAETMAPILETEVQRREPGRLFRGVREAGLVALPFTAAFVRSAPGRGTVADFAAATAPPGRPAGFGLVVSRGGEVLSHRDALGSSRTATAVLAGGGRVAGEVVAYDPETGLVLVQLEQATWTELPPAGAERAAPGTAAVAVGHLDGLEFVAPVFLAAAREDGYVLTGAGGTLLPGMPVVNLDGQTLAVTAAGAAPVRAYAVAPALARLHGRIAQGRALPRTIGLTLQTIDSELSRLLGAGGAVIADIERSGPGERAGLHVGDVVLALAGRQVTTVPQTLEAIAALPADEPASVTVRRGTREASVSVVPRVTFEHPGERTDGSPARVGPRAEEVFTPAALQRARLRPDAVVLEVAGVATSSAADVKAARRGRKGPLLVRVRQDRRPFFAVVEPDA
ncbi:MAG TPA: PDZ domain-containing protein [Vicinamibacteria bacterium]|nr:PDZ domain-containing protein [Vicinamibacteria bacterium]